MESTSGSTLGSYPRCVFRSGNVFDKGLFTMSKAINEFATNLQSPLFATRDTIEDAYKYAADIINTLPTHEQIAVHTAMQVVINTIAERVKQMTEETEGA
jgi:hypothetical protein